MRTEFNLDTLTVLFRRAGSLPDLSGRCVSLLQLLDDPDFSFSAIERLIAEDPALSANIIRHAQMHRPAVSRSTTSLRSALIDIGQKEIRTLTISLMVQRALVHDAPGFDYGRYSQNAAATALIARYVYARRQYRASFESAWSADDIYAAALLYGISLPILAKCAGSSFSRVHRYASRANQSYAAAFETLYRGSLFGLGAEAARTWRLPSLFEEVLSNFEQPWEHEDEYIALSCVNYAVHLAGRHVISVEPWVSNDPVLPEVELEVGLTEREIDTLASIVRRSVMPPPAPPAETEMAA